MLGAQLQLIFRSNYPEASQRCLNLMPAWLDVQIHAKPHWLRCAVAATTCDEREHARTLSSSCLHCSILDTCEEPASCNKADGAQRGSCFAGQAFCVLLFFKRITASCPILPRHVLPKNADLCCTLGQECANFAQYTTAGDPQGLAPPMWCMLELKYGDRRFLGVSWCNYRRPSESESRHDQTMLVV